MDTVTISTTTEPLCHSCVYYSKQIGCFFNHSKCMQYQCSEYKRKENEN